MASHNLFCFFGIVQITLIWASYAILGKVVPFPRTTKDDICVCYRPKLQSCWCRCRLGVLIMPFFLSYRPKFLRHVIWMWTSLPDTERRQQSHYLTSEKVISHVTNMWILPPHTVQALNWILGEVWEKPEIFIPLPPVFVPMKFHGSKWLSEISNGRYIYCHWLA